MKIPLVLYWSANLKNIILWLRRVAQKIMLVFQNNVKIVLVCFAWGKKIYPAYVSKYNSNCEKQAILLMIPSGQEWNYVAVEKLSALVIGITSET